MPVDAIGRIKEAARSAADDGGRYEALARPDDVLELDASTASWSGTGCHTPLIAGVAEGNGEVRWARS